LNSEEFQKLVLNKLDLLDEIKKDIADLKQGQKEIKDQIMNLEAKNANRHLELENKLNVLEEVTASNWTDIIKLKKAK